MMRRTTIKAQAVESASSGAMGSAKLPAPKDPICGDLDGTDTREPIEAVQLKKPSKSSLEPVVSSRRRFIRGATIAAAGVAGGSAAQILGPQSASYAAETTSLTMEELSRIFAPALVDGQAPVRRNELFINVRDYGALGDGITDDTASIMAAVAAAAEAGGARVIFPAGDYRANNLTIPDYVILEGVGGGFARFGPQIGIASYGWRKAAVRIYRLSGSTLDPVVHLKGAGSGIRNMQLEGAGAVGTILVSEGFETQVEDVRCINGGGIGIDVWKANNTRWRNVYVDNCGSQSLPGMKVWSKTGAGGANETNSFDVIGLTIERCANVALDLAYNPSDLADRQYWAEFVRIFALHVESNSTNANVGAGRGNIDPLIRVGNIRSLNLIAPFVYGGPGFLLVHDQKYNRSYGNGGIRIDEGTFIGSDTTTGLQETPSIIHLVTGDDFKLNGRLLRHSGKTLVIEPSYGGAVWISPTCYPAPNIMDGRVAKTNSKMFGNHEFTGHVVSSGLAPVVSGSSSIMVAPVQGVTDYSGKVRWGTGATPASGVLFTIAFSEPYASEPPINVTAGTPKANALGLSASSSRQGVTIRCTNKPEPNQPAGTYEISYRIG